MLKSENELRRPLARMGLELRFAELSSRALWLAGGDVRLLPKLEAVAAARAAATPERRALDATAFIAESST